MHARQIKYKPAPGKTQSVGSRCSSYRVGMHIHRHLNAKHSVLILIKSFSNVGRTIRVFLLNSMWGLRGDQLGGDAISGPQSSLGWVCESAVKREVVRLRRRSSHCMKYVSIMFLHSRRRRGIYLWARINEAGNAQSLAEFYIWRSTPGGSFVCSCWSRSRKFAV